MDRASQPARTGLTDRLAPDIARINFYRFCQLLEQSQQNAPLGSTDNPATDAVRFRPHPGMGFPVSELKNVERDAGNPDVPPTVRTTFSACTAWIRRCQPPIWTTLPSVMTDMTQ